MDLFDHVDLIICRINPYSKDQIESENINAVNGKDWMVEDENVKFADSVATLLTDNEKRLSIGKNGSDFIKCNFTWDVARKKFEELLIE